MLGRWMEGVIRKNLSLRLVGFVDEEKWPVAHSFSFIKDSLFVAHSQRMATEEIDFEHV